MEQVTEVPLTDSSQTAGLTMDGSGDQKVPAEEASKGASAVVEPKVGDKVEPMQVSNGDEGKSNDDVKPQEKPTEGEGNTDVTTTETSQPETCTAVAMETGESTENVNSDNKGDSKEAAGSQEKDTESSNASAAASQPEPAVAMDTEESSAVVESEKKDDNSAEVASVAAASVAVPAETGKTSEQNPGNEENSTDVTDSTVVRAGTKRPASEEAEGGCEAKIAAPCADTVEAAVPSETNVKVPDDSGTVGNVKVPDDSGTVGNAPGADEVPSSTNDTQTTGACKRPASEEAEAVCKQRITETSTANEATSASSDLTLQDDSTVDKGESIIKSTEKVEETSTGTSAECVVSTSMEAPSEEPVAICTEKVPETIEQPAGQVDVKSLNVIHDKVDEKVESSQTSQVEVTSQAPKAVDSAADLTTPTAAALPNSDNNKDATPPADTNNKDATSPADTNNKTATPSPADTNNKAVTPPADTNNSTVTAAADPVTQEASNAVKNSDAGDDSSEAMSCKVPESTKESSETQPIDNGGETAKSTSSVIGAEANPSSKDGQVAQSEPITENVTEAAKTTDSTVSSSSAPEAESGTAVQGDSCQGEGGKAQVSQVDSVTDASAQPVGTATEQQEKSVEPSNVSTPAATDLTVVVGEPTPQDKSELYSPTSAYANVDDNATDNGPPGEGPPPNLAAPATSESNEPASQIETETAAVAGETTMDISSPITPTLSEDAVDPNVADNGPPGEDAVAAVTTSSDASADLGQPITVQAISVSTGAGANKQPYANPNQPWNQQANQQGNQQGGSTPSSYPTYNGQMQWNQGGSGNPGAAHPFGQYGAPRPPYMNNSLAYAQQYSQWQQNYSGAGNQQQAAGQYYNYGQYGGYGQGYPGGQMFNQAYDQRYTQQQGYNQAYMQQQQQQQQQGYSQAQQQGYYDWSQSQGYNYGNYYNAQNQSAQSSYSTPTPPAAATPEVKAPILTTAAQRNVVISVPIAKNKNMPVKKDLSGIPLPPMNIVTAPRMIPTPVTPPAQTRPPIISNRTKEEIAAQLLQKARAKQVSDQPPPPASVEVEKPAESERRHVPDPMVTPKHLCIGNLPEGTKATALRDMLAYFGKVVNCKVAAGKGANAGIFAFVTIDCLTDASTLISSLNGWEFNGCKLTAKKLKSIPGSKPK